MSYFRRPMGDGPITDPSQVDPTVTPPIATVPPTRVDCSQLPSDSPFRQPGQVCAPPATATSPSGSMIDDLRNLFTLAPTGAPDTSASGGSAAASIPPIVWVGAAAAAAYYLFGKKGKR